MSKTGPTCCQHTVQDPANAAPSRRTFFSTLAGIALALCTLPKVAFAQAKKVVLPLAKAEKLQKVGGFMITKIKDKELLLIRDSEKTVRAFDSMCTHEKCALTYDVAGKRVKCPCHNAYFDLNGKVLSGPPPKPLGSYPTALAGEKLTITL